MGDLELTAEQIKQIVGAARVFAPGFSEEKLQWLISCQSKLADTGFCEAAWGLSRLEKEKGVTTDDALDTVKKLLIDKANLEANVASLKQKHQNLQKAVAEVDQRYKQVMAASKKAEVELDDVQTDIASEHKYLAAYQKEAAKEKEKIDREIEKCRQKAKVTEQEVVAAGELKSEVERSGFSLEQMLALSKEFVGLKDGKEKLIEAVKKHGTLTGSIAAMEKKGESQKKAFNSELATIRCQRDREQAQVQSMEENRRVLERIIAELRNDEAVESELRNFYRKYFGLSRFFDYIAGWKQVAFLRCNSPMASLANAVNPAEMAHFCTDKEPRVCPHCGGGFIYDEKAYKALQVSPGWVRFGEVNGV